MFEFEIEMERQYEKERQQGRERYEMERLINRSPNFLENVDKKFKLRLNAKGTYFQEEVEFEKTLR